jgi:hypothetical protein
MENAMNGAAALAILPIAPAATRAIKLHAVPSDAEIAIGKAAAAAALGVGHGFVDLIDDGRLSAAARVRGSETIADVAMLALDYMGGDDEFAAIMRREGRRELWRRHGNAFHQGCAGTVLANGSGLDVAKLNATLDMMLDTALEIVQRVVESERAYRWQ